MHYIFSVSVLETLAMAIGALGLVAPGVGLLRWMRSRRAGWVFVHRDGVPIPGALILVAGKRFTTNEVGEAAIPVSLEGRRASVRNPAMQYREETAIVLQFESGALSVSI